MDEITVENYKYSAFISYSHRNMKEAEWVQNQLEKFRLPGQLKRQHPDAHKKLAPVFRDKTDFNTGELEEIVEEKLRDSRYLIVICSPESAASEYVNHEISYFIALGREKNIIPFIIDGVPGSTDCNCYPPALKPSLIGANAVADGRQKAFVRVVATMLSMDFDLLWRREHRRQRLRQIHAACVALMVVLCLITGIIAVLPHRTYYRTLTSRYGYPVGIGEVTSEQRKHMNCFYCITTELGSVKEVKCLNSAYELTTSTVDSALENASRVVYSDGLNRVEYYDSANILRFVVKYSASSLESELAVSDSDTLTVAIDFLETDEGSGNATTLGANSGTDLLDVQDEMFSLRSGIVRKLVTFDEDGYLIREMYMLDNRNTPVMDSNGNYGIAYTYNENGLIESEIFLDSDGNAHDCNLGYAVTTTEYNDQGLIVKQTSTNLAGEPAADSDGIYYETIEWSEAGNPIQISMYDTDGEPLNVYALGCSVQQIDYDKNGFSVEFRSYGPDGELYPTDGACIAKNTYDDLGNALTTRYFNADGEPAEDDQMGYGIQFTYEGRTATSYTWLDENGNPTEVDGVCVTELHYNSAGFITDRIGLHADGTPAADATTGVYWIHLEYQNDNVTEYRCLDANGEPMLCTDGFYVIKYTYDSNGNQSSWTACGLGMEPVETSYGFSYYTSDYNEQGQLLKLTYYNADGWPVEYCGAARIDNEYDEMARLTVSQCYDKSGVLTDVNTYTYTEDGNCAFEEISYSYDVDGSWLVTHTEEDGSSYTEAYDADGILYARDSYDADGNLTRDEIFDDSGALLQTMTVTRPTDDEIVYTTMDADEVVEEIYYKDAEEHTKRSEIYYSDGKLRSVQTYDENGYLVESVSYDMDGVETSHIQAEYNSAGYLSRTTSFDLDGVMTEYEEYSYSDDGSGAVEKFDANGNRLSYTLYNLAGLAIEETIYDEWGQEAGHQKMEYDDLSRLSKVTWIATNGTISAYGSYYYFDDGSYNLGIYHTNHIPQATWIYDTDGNKTTEIEYDQSGRTSKETYLEPDGSVQLRVQYSYYENGNWSVHTTDGDGKSILTDVYDINERIIEETRYEDGVEVSHETKAYDDSGRIIKVTRLNPGGKVHDYTEYIYADDGAYIEKNYTYGGILVSIVHYGPDGSETKNTAWPPV